MPEAIVPGRIYLVHVAERARVSENALPGCTSNDMHPDFLPAGWRRARKHAVSSRTTADQAVCPARASGEQAVSAGTRAREQRGHQQAEDDHKLPQFTTSFLIERA